MKRYINTAFIYAVAAMLGGVFYREFTKWNEFTGKSSLGVVHTHLFMLGMILFLIVALFVDKYDMSGLRKFRAFYVIYNVGVVLTTIMFVVRGIVQVLQTPLSKGGTAAISGIAGIGHILIGVGLILFFLSLKESVKK